MSNSIKMVLISAPSGTGKSTVIEALLRKNIPLEFSISTTTRNKRGNEIENVSYYFISEKKFVEKVKNDEFVEYEEVYPGKWYGTTKKEIERILTKKKCPLFELDVAGGSKLKQRYSDQLLAIFISPPSLEELRNRLLKRNTEGILEIDTRVKKAEKELSYQSNYDKVILNKDFATCVDEVYNCIKDFLENSIK